MAIKPPGYEGYRRLSSFHKVDAVEGGRLLFILGIILFIMSMTMSLSMK